MKVNAGMSRQTFLVSAAAARALDEDASRDWGLSPFALVEAAGRNCARRLVEWLGTALPAAGPSFPAALRVTVLAGSGNNGADALVLLRALILEHGLFPQNSAALLNRLPEPGDVSPRAEAVRALGAMGVAVRVWDEVTPQETLLSSSHVIIDGVAGTGLSGPLRDVPLAMVRALNRLREVNSNIGKNKIERLSQNFSFGKATLDLDLTDSSEEWPLIVSVDVPSGNSDGFKGGWPVVTADAVLAIEPAKLALYKPAARIFAGTIIPVGGIFPFGLIKKYGEAELVSWETARERIPAVAPDSYKYTRGVAEIRAGSSGSAGAARIAAQGAGASGAGLVRLAVDAGLYPVLAASAGGIMVFESGSAADDSNRFKPDSVLLGPGWGKAAGRQELLEAALRREGEGTPLILDADAIALAKGKVFHGNTILTPHPGELANFAGVSKEELLADTLCDSAPGPANAVSILKRIAREVNAVILFKAAVLVIAGPDGRLAVVDGMAPVLAAGGSGDLLAGLCAGITARMRALGTTNTALGTTNAAQSPRDNCTAPVDLFTSACAAAALLIAAAKAPASRRFADPLDLAAAAATLAGDAWLPAL
jgi:NAD(P)H-hydrate epimerase